MTAPWRRRSAPDGRLDERSDAAEGRASLVGKCDLLRADRRGDRKLALECVRELAGSKRGPGRGRESVPREAEGQGQNGGVAFLGLKLAAVVHVADMRVLDIEAEL